MLNCPHWLRWPTDTLYWIALALCGVLLSRNTNWDMTILDWFFDANQQSFPLKDQALWSKTFHQGSKNLTIILWLSMAAWAYRIRDRTELTPWIFVLISALLAVSINGWLKAQSAHSCPWALTHFGGHADYFRLLAALPDNPGPGHCLPSGHAAVGFMWLPLIYASACWWPRHLKRISITVISFGLFCGGIQIARGAHFPSHIIMAAAVCGLTSSLCFHTYQYRKHFARAISRISHGLELDKHQ